MHILSTLQHYSNVKHHFSGNIVPEKSDRTDRYGQKGYTAQ